MFVSHFKGQNLIPLSYATLSLLVICAILILLILLSASRKQGQKLGQDFNQEEYFSLDTTKTLRGLAILFLILGHMSNQVFDSFLPLYWAAAWAVIIFLFASGIGLTKKYGLSKLATSFWKNRIKRLMYPVWITLVLFYSLDYFILNRRHGPISIILHFLGVISPDPPNGPDWFISYILYSYLTFYIASLLSISRLIKSGIILFFSYFAVFCIFKLFPYLSPKLGAYIFHYCDNWILYSIVFPTSILIGIYQEKVFNFLKSVYRFSRPIYIISMLSLLLTYKYDLGIPPLLKMVPSRVLLGVMIKSLAPIYLVVFLTMFAYLLDIMRVRWGFLVFLGEYSLEIYLLHLPFLIYYDFFLFRKPLLVYFFCYLLFILFLSYLLKKSSSFLNQIFSQRLIWKPS